MLLAQFDTTLDEAATGAYGSESAVPSSTLFGTLSSLIGVALSLLGVIFLILMIYAGFLWMTAQGDPKQVQKAKDILRNATIGVVLVTASYALSSRFLADILTAVGG